jgi:hypothetical protein
MDGNDEIGGGTNQREIDFGIARGGARKRSAILIYWW